MAADLDLQDEVERILRKLSLEDIKAVATHLEIQDLDAVDNARTVLRSVQDQFDNAANADARTLLLRDLPIPEPHLANYRGLFEPDAEQVVPEADVNVGVNADVVDGGGQNVNGGAVVGQDGGAPNGVGVPMGGDLGRGPLGGLAGGAAGGFQAPNNNNIVNAGFPQQNMGQGALQQNVWQQQNLGGYRNLTGFQNAGGLQTRGDVRSQNPWTLGGIQPVYGAHMFGMQPQNGGVWSQNLQSQIPQFPVLPGAAGNNVVQPALAGPQLNVARQNLGQMANIPAQVAAVRVPAQNASQNLQLMKKATWMTSLNLWKRR